MIYIALLSLIVHSALQQYILTILNSLHLQFFTILKSNQMLVFQRGENRRTRRKTSRSRVENQQTQPTYDAESGNRTLVEGERSHHCANPAPLPCNIPCNIPYNIPCNIPHRVTLKFAGVFADWQFFLCFCFAGRNFCGSR